MRGDWGHMKSTFVYVGKVRGQGRPRFAQGHAYQTKADTTFKAHIADEYRKQGGLFYGAMPLSVTIDIQRTLPKSLWDRAKALFDTGKPDCDNIAKAVLDALNGVAFDDDSQVVTLIVRKFPRVRMPNDNDQMRVTVSEVDTETVYPQVYIPE